MFRAKWLLGISCVFGVLLLATFIRRSTLLPVHAQSTGCTDQVLNLAQSQLTNTLAYTSTSQFPTETNPANSNHWNLAASSQWTSGFFPGSLWFMYENTLDNSWMARATSQTASMLSQDTNASDHDIGFKILGSYGNAYRITRDPSYLSVIQTAAQAMTTLYRPTAGVIESWPNYDSHITVIIDNMMNLELLFFAAQNGGDPSLYDMAVSHAVKTMQNHVRPDGSTFHVVDYNPDGTVFSKFTVQGAGTNTTWSRGQAWAIYGFTMTYRYTHDPRFLATAQSTADYFLNNLPPDFVPYWDFSECCTQPRDSSAAAIAAAGLFELGTYVTASADQARYRTAALNIQSSHSSPAYLGSPLTTDGILLHGSADVPAGDSDKSLIYGDYYFIQGCYRATSPPPAPTNLAAMRASGTQINLSWDAQSGAIRYSAKRSNTPGGPYTPLAPPPLLTTNSYADTAVNPSSIYYYVVSATNVRGEGPDSAEASSAVVNPLPAISSISPTNIPAGAGFTLTVNGANFSSASVLNFSGKAEPTTFLSATQLTAAIPATDVSTGGTPAVTVSNQAGASPAVTFAINDFTLGALAAITVASGMSASSSITVTPSNSNGFAGAIAFSVSGLPSNVTATFNPPSVTPGAGPVSTTLTLSAAAHSATILVAPTSGSLRSPFRPVYLLAALLAQLLLLRFWRRPKAQVCLACLSLALLLSIGSALSGCGGGSVGGTTNTTTPPPQAVTSQLTVTAQSGSDSKATTLSVTVQ